MKTCGLPLTCVLFTSDDLSSCVRLALQKRQQHRGLIRAVHAGLDCLLKHCVDRSWTKVIRKLLHQFSVQMWAVVTVFVHIDAHWNDTKTNEHCSILTSYFAFVS